MIDLIAGTRPNFVKVAALLPALRSRGIGVRVIHTGQHPEGSAMDLFRELTGEEPDIFLGGNRNTPTVARVYERYANVLELSASVDQVMVVGDVDSTLGAALAAQRAGREVIHVESGLRSFDRSMPEEINRMLVDDVSTVLFATEVSAVINLANQSGVMTDEQEVALVGNVMIDTLLAQVSAARSLPAPGGKYALVTIHRAAHLRGVNGAMIRAALRKVSEQVTLLCPMHPSTQEAWGDWSSGLSNIIVYPPFGYRQFLRLMMGAECVITDSGGVQDETSYLKVPCLTVRPNTERPITVECGSSRLVWPPSELPGAVEDALSGTWPVIQTPPLWDGQAAGRIAEYLLRR